MEYDEEEYESEYEDSEADYPISPLLIPPRPPLTSSTTGGGAHVSLVEMVVAAVRRSFIMCSTSGGGGGADEEESSSSSSSSLWGGSPTSAMQIGGPTDVQHVTHVTFDRFSGFLGLPSDLEPEVPRPVPSASASVFGVSPTSMQCSYDKRGNSVPTILLSVQMNLYQRGGLEAEGIFRINAENGQEIFVRDQLNRGLIPDGVDLHCLAGLIKAWFRELPTGVLDSLTSEELMHCNTEEQCSLLATMLPPMEAALLDWAINLMADVVEHEQHNKMNARNIAMVFAPNMTQMADPLTALIHAVQVMNFLKTLILRTLKEREEAASAAGVFQSCSGSPSDKDEPHTSEPLEKPVACSSQRNMDCSIIARTDFNEFLFGAGRALEVDAESFFQGLGKSETSNSEKISPLDCNLMGHENGNGKEFSNGILEGISNRFSFRKGVGKLCRHPMFQLSKSMKKSGELGVVNAATGESRQACV